ncbi:uncharacterized protein [Battus philenor]|uniref:uncharacterized protein n=1 Tax=Battus philenor TaxID=42288 RepID=UPI0035CF1FEB
MAQHRTFYNSLLQCINNNNDSSMLVEFATSMRYATRKDIYDILEILHVSAEVQAQVKLFSILAAYMVSNGTQSDIIIKFNPMYAKISAILTRGLPKKTVVTLNFLTSLLYNVNENKTSQRRAQVVYAQNMIRTSGCLAAMSSLYAKGMLHQDTSQALCRCLSEACYGLEANQNYCSQLIPLVGQWVIVILHAFNLNDKGIRKETQINKIGYEDDFNLGQGDDTADLLQNIMKEINKCKAENVNIVQKTPFTRKAAKPEHTYVNKYCNRNIENIQDNSYSFSFLNGKNDTSSNFDNLNWANNYGYSNTDVDDTNLCAHTSHTSNYAHSPSYVTVTRDKVYENSIVDFRPTLISTPKNSSKNNVNITTIPHTTRKLVSLKENRHRHKDIATPKAKSNSKMVNKNVLRHSLGSRIYNVVNESCTTLLKRFKNIFGSTNNRETVLQASDNSCAEDLHEIPLSNSFTNYMRQRDALLSEAHNSHSWDEQQNECDTCNNTVSLKQKLSDDIFLQKTVNKLKTGINLFGCDFKRISKTFWPDEKYMTPSVLYNLYRKLIVK